MNERANKKVIIDPGHGGADPGTSANGITEKDYTLKISKYMANRLNELGIENALTREDDITLDSDSRPKKVQNLFGTGSDVIVVSNHINAGGGDGAEIIYALRNTDSLSKKIAEEFIKSGQNVRKYYQRRLPSDPSKDYYYILRNTPNNETIIVEYGFADSTKDDPDQIKNNWENLAESVVKALAEYINVPYTPPKNINNYYIVKKGDSLYKIANEYGITVNELKNANNLTSNLLSIGQYLIIPSITNVSNDSENIYVVKANDTLYKIANTYGMTVNEIKTLNNLTTDILNIGQVLKIINNKTNTENDKYTVIAGDSLYSIAKKFGTTVEAIKSINNKNSNLLSIGEILIIPRSTNNKYYVVKAGDTLWQIAKAYNTTVNAIKNANSLSNNILTIGSTLIIP